MLLSMLIAALIVSLLSLVGIFIVGHTSSGFGTHRLVLPLAVGVFLGVVFFELIPETLEISPLWGPLAIVCGFLGFYVIAHLLETYHHHHGDEEDHCEKKSARLLLVGDAIHNFADGIVIATAFMIDPTVGFLTTIGVALHEIPQEIAEFGVLIRSGYTRVRALSYNFLSATTVIVGTVVTYYFTESLEGSLFILTGIAAGNLLYIATADLIPELRESHRGHFGQTFAATLIGVVGIALLVTYTHERFMAEHAHDESAHSLEENHTNEQLEDEDHAHSN
jgi:zinc and cadmium transporter